MSMSPASHRYDVVGSCVLFNTPLDEITRIAAQFAQSGCRTHLIFVDNSPKPMAMPVFDPERVTVLRPGRNLGYGAGNNCALTASAGWSRYFLILNSDLEFDGQGIDRMVSYLDYHPDVVLAAPKVVYPDGRLQTLCRLLPTADLEALVKDHLKRWRGVRQMRVTSHAGTELRIDLQGAVMGGNWGYTTRPGTMTHWPGGLALAFPAAHSVHGTLVLAEGDVNLTFKRYLEKPIALHIEHDHIETIEGQGLDADLMRSYIAAWGDRSAYAVSHVGYGLNPAARWDSMALLDKRDFNGTELRAFAGNFLYSTGANETAGRHTLGHFDLPMRHCTVQLDGEVVVREGQLA